MWSGKMAARMRRKDGTFNADNCGFLADSCHHELLSSADVDGMNSCADHSILSILEEPIVGGEDKSGVEAENESLLSALSEMLDSVEDDDESLSPFDVLPDTKLLTHPGRWDTSVVVSVSGRAATQPTPPNLSVAIKRDGEEDENKVLTDRSQTLKSKRTEKEVEVFTSSSLVNLVKLMHPYCLRLRVEEEEEEMSSVREDHTLFSQEEVWRYERPTEESDEEINVVSDEEEPAKEEVVAEHKHEARLLKSALLNGNSSKAPPCREKKRVSFGPVQVASYDDLAENEANEKSATCGDAGVTPPEPQSTPPADTSSAKETAPPPKAETKAKSLSLQQYRQLRHKRRPLVEKQGNNTTKWPSIAEPPKELTPILNLQRHPSCGPKILTDQPHKPGKKTASHHATTPPPPRPLNASHHMNLKRPSPVSTPVSPASPLPGCAAIPHMKVQERSPVKKQTSLSIDPPNPVLLPLPVHHAAQQSTGPSSSPSKIPPTDSDLSNAHLQKTQIGSSAPQRHHHSSEPKRLKRDHAAHPQDSRSNLTPAGSHPSSAPPSLSPTPSDSHNLLPHTARAGPTKEGGLEPKTPHPQTPRLGKCPTSPAPGESPKRTNMPGVSPMEATPLLQVDCRLQSAASDSGIEASDLTSLLEQFEETQAIEERVCESACPPEPEPRSPQISPVDALALSSYSESLRTLKALGKLPQPQTPEQVPQPLSTEVILSTPQGQPTRRRNPPSKSIQIIEPRPLPSRRSHNTTLEPNAAPAAAAATAAAATAALMYLSVSCDHDYCGSMVGPQVTGQEGGAVKASSLSHVPEIPHESQGTPVDSATQSAIAQARVSEEQLVAGTETDASADAALRFTHSGASEASYTLPTPPPTPPDRGRTKTSYRKRSASSGSSSSSCRSSSSSSSSSSASRSPKRRRLHRSRSDSSSCSSSPCRSISPSPPRRRRQAFPKSIKSRSRSRSWSRSRSSSRSPSPRICRRQWKEVYRSRESRKLRREHELRIQKLKAIDERRVVYVGRIRRSMTHEELRERFTQFGEVEGVSLHFRERGDHFGFVTFFNMEDAFAAIDNAFKLRRPDELPFDICFGGRRQFCNSNYSDLDANRDADPPPAMSRFKDVDFDSLLKQAQRGLRS